MKKIFTILIAAITLICLSSCNNGLKTKLDDEQAQVSFLLEFDGKNITLENSSRNIGLDSVQNALKEFKFNVKFTNKDDSSKVISQSGDIVWLSSYLSYISLSKGRWTITITGQIPNVDSKLYGTTDFTVGGREVYFYLTLKISGSAPGSIKFTMPGVGTSKPNVALIPLDKYLDGTYTTEDVIPFNNESSESAYYEEVDTDDISVFSTFIITGIAPEVYYFTVDPIEPENPQYTDIATVYPGLTSTGIQSDGQAKLILDLQCGNVPGLKDITVPFEGGIASLPGYGKNVDNPIPVRPGYLFTGWYDSREAAEFGLFPSIPRDQKYITQQVPYSEGVYKIANRTLYAGWQKADLPEEFFNQNFVFTTRHPLNGGNLIVRKMDNLLPYQDGEDSMLDPTTQYVTIGTTVYMAYDNELYYADLANLHDYLQDPSTQYITPGTLRKIEIPKVQELDNDVLSLYYDYNGHMYAFCAAWVDTENAIWNIVSISIPTGDQEPVATLYAAEKIEAGEESAIGKESNQDPVIRILQNSKFAIYNNQLFVYRCFRIDDYTSDYIYYFDGKVIAFDMTDDSSVEGFGKTFQGKNTAISQDEFYESTYYGSFDGMDIYTVPEVTDMYADGTTVYLLYKETNFDPVENSNMSINTLVSTGAVITLNYDMTLKGKHGRAEERQFGSTTVYTVSHEYDTNYFTGPVKLLAIFERKMLIQESGRFVYYRRPGESGYYLKRKMGRVTVFDLDSNCISYTQPTDLALEESGSLIDPDNVSLCSWDEND